MSKYRYGWTKRYSVPAQVVGEIVERFPENTAENIVREARKRASPLHKLFEWDDSAAAEQFRLVQARVMISSLRVEIVDVAGKVNHVVAFIGDADRTGDLGPVLEADADALSSAEAHCLRQMLAFKAKWRGLQFAAAVLTAIDGVTRSARRRPKKKRRAGKRA